MDLGLKGKVAVVTASSKGLGRAIAEQLAAEGVNLALCSRDFTSITHVAESIRQQYGVQVIAEQADLKEASAIPAFIGKVIDTYGRIDALLCNSGGPPSGSFIHLQDQAWEDAFQGNLMSVIRLIRECYPYLKENGGRIVTIASSSVKIPIPGLVLSNTFRAGIAGLMKTLSIEFGPDGILVNTVCPGRISTDRLNEIDGVRAQREAVEIEQIRAAAMKDIPLGRYGEPQELAVFSSFLLSPLNSYLTGSVFYVDGGMVKAL